MSALFYLDLCSLKNTILSIGRSRSRLALWIVFVGVAVVMLFLRSLRRSHSSLPVAAFPGTLAVAIGGAALLLVAATLILAALGQVAAFRSRAEARLLCTSAIAPFTIVFWLALRRLGTVLAGRMAPSIVYFFLFVTDPSVALASTIHWFVATVVLVTALSTLQIPVFVTAKRGGVLPFVIVGAALAAAGLAYMALGAGSTLHVAWTSAALAHLPWTPASVVTALSRGDARYVVAFALVPPALIALTPFVGGDALPELYEASLRRFAARESRVKVRGSRSAARQPAGARAYGSVPAGAATILWKDWLDFRRSRFAVAWIALCVLALAAGLALLVAGGRVREVYESLLSPLAFALPLLIVTLSRTRLAREIAKPVWWLSSVPLRRRLWVWTFAKTWRTAAPVVLFGIGAAVATGIVFTILALPGAVVVLWALTALGVALYAAFPNPAERGPLALVRIFATFVVLAPVVGAFIVVLAVSDSFAFAIAAASLVALVEGVVALEGAALSILRNGVALARDTEAS